MKLPTYIACITSYYKDDPSVVVMHSIVVVKSKNNGIVTCNKYDLSDYTEDDACNEIEDIIKSYKKVGIVDVIYSTNPVKLIKSVHGEELKMITVEEYKKFVNR